MMQFNADLYRIAAMFQLNEQSRYYLCGVHVESCAAGGVVLTATDGQRLICVRDENGRADQSGIVALPTEALKACKSKPREQRRVTVAGESATIEVSFDAETWAPCAMAQNVIVDGAFPDVRRVIPTEIVQDASKAPHGWFDGRYVASFAAAAGELEKQAGRAGKAGVCYCVSDADSPALVLFAAAPHAFGVLMPIRADDRRSPPAWFFPAKSEEKQETAA